MTENILHNQHYLCIIAKRYLMQLYGNEDEDETDHLCANSTGKMDQNNLIREIKKVCTGAIRNIRTWSFQVK